ncbi:hypothetical protein RclHR1_19610002 [Rhizophagus clarus]|uniref:Protein kinase domain-containing protein n=1 Tax=Rhizophagus clarus TaxID=94130 RepID=A0A2Z6R365_9GLOM|nr:hypothetical protein RclHR1_19610002 [Rhizophagus clarus]
MSYSNNQLVNATINRVHALTDYKIHNDLDKQYEFQKKTILADVTLTDNEKSEAMKALLRSYDLGKITYNVGKRRICENCDQECLATSYCEYCVRNYLKENFSNWASGNDNIDNLIKEFQMNAFIPDKIPEWIPYNKFQNIKYLTKGGCSEIYIADWIDGGYIEWDSEKKELKRFGEFGFKQTVILKRLENVESANQRWFEEAKSHLTISNKWPDIVQCFGLTQEPLNRNYMLVMNKMDMDLRKYLQQNHNQLSWKERMQIIISIILALTRIHKENAIHRDLHSGNILFKKGERFFISDLGFCGPADKSLKSIYGNLPYVAPEVIVGKETTSKSDIYSIAMLMWEISSGQPPFINYEHNYDLAMNIVNGIRPKIVSGTPLEYKNLMKQCWDADPSIRPDIDTLWTKINEINILYQNKSDESLTQPGENNNLKLENFTSNSKLFTSKVHQFENLPEPRNATEEELEVFHSRLYDFYIPNNINDFDKLSNQKDGTSKINSIFEDVQKNDCKGGVIQKQIKKYQVNFDDEDEVHNSPNLHSEEQDKLAIPDGIIVFLLPSSTAYSTQVLYKNLVQKLNNTQKYFVRYQSKIFISSKISWSYKVYAQKGILYVVLDDKCFI